MKTRISIYFALLASAFILTACPLTDDIDELLETEGPVEYSKTFTLDLKEGDPLEVQKSEPFSTSYKGLKITDVKINSLTGTFDNIENPSGAKLSFRFTFANSGSHVSAYEGLPIEPSLNGKEQNLMALAGREIKTYEAFLVANPEATLESFFETTTAPIRFDFTIKLNATVTGTPE